MIIDKNKLKTLWYENEQGEIWTPPPNSLSALVIPHGFKYQHTMFPNIVHHLILDTTTNKNVMRGSKSWPEDLILAMANSDEYTVCEAILILNSCCERCMNVLAFMHALDWGYKHGSVEWDSCNTICGFCEDDKKHLPVKPDNSKKV